MSAISDYITGLSNKLGYWSLTETTGTNLVEGGGTLGDGTLVGTYTMGEPGVPQGDTAIYFNPGGATDGTARLGYNGYNAAASGKNNFVIGCFYKLPTGYAVSGTLERLMTFHMNAGANAAPALGLSISSTAQTVSLSVASGSADTTNNSFAGANRTLDVWHLIVGHALLGTAAAGKLNVSHDGAAFANEVTITSTNANYVSSASTASNDFDCISGRYTGGSLTERIDATIAHPFILHTTLKADALIVAQNLWSIMNWNQNNTHIRKTSGYYSIHHLGL